MLEMEILQTATLAVLGFIVTELRALRKELSDSRERLSSVETAIGIKPTGHLQRTK